MSIRIKILLIIIPPIFLGIFFIGLWSTKIFTEYIYTSNNELSILYLDKIVDDNLKTRTDLLDTTGLANSELYKKSYQNEALKSINNESIKYNRNIYVIDKNAQVISDIKFLKKNSLTLWENISKKVKLNSGFTQGYLPFNDTKMLYVAKYFEPWDWVVVVSISEEELLSIIYDTNKTILLTSLSLAFFVGLFIYIVLYKLLLVPISKLQKASNIIAKHEPLEKININTKDEFLNLANSIENMYLSISKKTKALQANEERFRRLFENSEVSIWNEDLTQVVKHLDDLRKDGVKDIHEYLCQNIHIAEEIAKKVKVIDVNNATLKLFNAHSKEHFLSGIEKTFGDDAIYIFIDELEAIWNKKESFSKEAFFKTFDGDVIHGLITFQIPKNPQYCSSISVSIIDITSLKKIEKELKKAKKELTNTNLQLTFQAQILEQSIAAADVIDENGLFYYVNDAYVKMWGYDSKDEILGTSPDTHCYDSKMPSIIIEKVEKEQEHLFEFKASKKDGSSFDALMAVKYVHFYGKKFYLGSTIDISELKNKEKMLINQSRHAAMGEMIGMIAHQWRQPITSISMDANNILLDIAIDDFNMQKAEEYANNVIQQTKYLSHTIDDFRNFFKPDKVISKVNLKEVFEQTLSIVKDSLKNNNIEFKSTFETYEPVNAYPRELMQVFVNIITNSKDALVNNNIQNAYISARVYEKKDHINIEICDNGGGIDTSILPKIFDPYFSTKDEKTGTGLGLYMSKMIIQEHLNGNIQAYNYEDGACFIIKLQKS